MDLLAGPGRFYKGNIHTHATASDAVRTWVVPASGEVSITGWVRKADTRGGDGVDLKVVKNDGITAPLWQITLASDDPSYHDLIVYDVSVSAGDEIRVVAVPGAPGETHIITYTALAEDTGPWSNCAEMTGDLWFGTSYACFEGQVTP